MKPVTNEADYDPYLIFGKTFEGANAINRCSDGYENDFAARTDWTLTSKYADANHQPVAVINGDTSRNVLSVSEAIGSMVELSAVGSSNPKKNSLSYAWSFYLEPISYQSDMKIENLTAETSKVSIPSDGVGKDMNLIL